MVPNISSLHENMKALSSFYHKNIFWEKMNVRHSMGVLHSFSIKNIFYDRMENKDFNNFERRRGLFLYFSQDDQH